MKRPIESDYTSHVAYTRALEGYSSQLEQAARQALEALENTSPLGFNMESDKKFFAAITALQSALKGTT